MAYIGIRFDNEVSQALMWKLFGLSHGAVHYGVPKQGAPKCFVRESQKLGQPRKVTHSCSRYLNTLNKEFPHAQSVLLS